MEDLNPKIVQQIEAFFVNYQKVRGIEVTIRGRAGPPKAREPSIDAGKTPRGRLIEIRAKRFPEIVQKCKSLLRFVSRKNVVRSRRRVPS